MDGAVPEDQRGARETAEVGEGIAVDDGQVRGLSRLDGAQVVLDAEQPCGDGGGAQQGLGRGEAVGVQGAQGQVRVASPPGAVGT